MDGVLVDSHWGDAVRAHRALFPEKLFALLEQEFTKGIHMHHYFLRAQEEGIAISEADFYDIFHRIAKDLYAGATITPGVAELYTFLKAQGYLVGIVTSSPKDWALQLVERLGWEDVDLVLSLNNHEELASKPAPDGYVYAMDRLGLDPHKTVIVEDSNPGIEAGKAADAMVIGFSKWVNDYVQEGADMYVESMEEIQQWIQYLDTEADYSLR